MTSTNKHVETGNYRLIYSLASALCRPSRGRITAFYLPGWVMCADDLHYRPRLDVRLRARSSERGRAPGLPMMPDKRIRECHQIRGGYDLDSEAVIATRSLLFSEHARL